MITTLILYAFYFGIVPIITLMPNGGDLPVGFANALNSFSPYWNQLDSIFPIGTALTVVLSYLFFEGIILSFKIVNWAIKKFTHSG